MRRKLCLQSRRLDLTKASVIGHCHYGPWVTYSPSNTEDVGSSPGTSRYIVGRMTTYNGGVLSLGPIPSGRLKNLNGHH